MMNEAWIGCGQSGNSKVTKDYASSEEGGRHVASYAELFVQMPCRAWLGLKGVS